MVLPILGALALGTAAAISAPIVAREAAAAAQTFLPGGVNVGQSRVLSSSTPGTQQILTSPGFKQADAKAREIVEAGVAAESSQAGKQFSQGNILGGIGATLAPYTYHVPGVKAFTVQAYESALTSMLVKQGYSQSQAAAAAKTAGDLYRAESSGEATGAIIASTLAEGVGASVAQKAASTSLARQAITQTGKAGFLKTATIFGGATGIGGLYEGAVTGAIRQAAPVWYGRKQFSPQELAAESALGGITAGVLGGGIAAGYARGATKRAGATLAAARIVDPYEYPGDVLGGFFAGKTGFKGVTVPTLSAVPSIVPTPTSTPTATQTPTSTETPTTTQTPTQTPTPTTVPTPTQTPTNVFVPTLTPTPTPTPTATPTPTETETPSETQTPTTTPTTTPTAVTIPTTTPVWRAPGFPVGMPLPPMPGLPGSGKIARHGRLTYYDELAVAKRVFRNLL